jgi:hypothetical protein
MRSLNLPALIDFYDRKVSQSIGHATAINAVMGEDLAINLFCDYASRNNLSPKILSEKCTQGTNSGKRLDCWIEINEKSKLVHFQTEIKNWSAHAFSGKIIPENASEDDMILYRIGRWENQFDSINKTLRQDPAKKVLIKMRPLSQYAEIRPLIIFWDAMHPSGDSKEYFPVDVDNESFKQLWVFSMSNYVRNLIKMNVFDIKVEMPSVINRFKWLNNLYQIDSTN